MARCPDRSSAGHHHRLSPGATFLAYTDGLIEQGGIPLDTSIDALTNIRNELPDDPWAIELLAT